MKWIFIVFPILFSIQCIAESPDNVRLSTAKDSSLPSIRIGSHSQLFLDDYLIESMEGLTRKVQSVRKCGDNPVLVPTEPWEEPYAIVYGSVIKEDGLFRIWYYGSSGVCYAQSEDGIHWTKPELDLTQYEGLPTNIVIDRNAPQTAANPFEYFYELFGVWKDPIDPNPNRRYKMGVLCIQRNYEGPREDPFHHGQRRGLGIAASPDGIHWKEGFDFATEAICDGATHLMWDAPNEKWVVYGRTKYVDEQLLKIWDNEWADRYYWGRSVARAENDNLIDWPESFPGEAPRVMTSDAQDPPGTEIYGMNVFPYEGIYIALIQMFYNQPEDCFLDVQLGVSRDGVHFERVADRSPFIPVGGTGEWDRFNQSPANNPPIEVGDELRFYYGGRSYRHSPYDGPDNGEKFGAVGFGSILRDRFVALEASYVGGTLTTRPLVLDSIDLTLNAESKFGEIRVMLLNDQGETLAESEPICSDGLKIPIQWKENPDSRIIESGIRVQFKIRNAKLYSFRQHPDDLR
ncbi:MAG: hypothetical protein H6752_11965 [Candidatus Omnitrophica bacterium]|nr:hypothetical protein [Candidatus Omnitrophota bacterium]